jgi:drug/metabolite transporter (DMT)-like permease
LLSAYLAWREPGVLPAIFRAWRRAGFAGFMGAIASQFWFLGFAIATAASVRTLGLVEVLFAQGVTHWLFKQKTSARELAGMALLVLGVSLLLWAY